MTDKLKKWRNRILIGAVLFAGALLISRQTEALPFSAFIRLALFLVPYLVVGWDILYKAGRNIAHGQVFDENFLMSIATIGAFVVGEYPEGVAVILFYQVGELFQSYAVNRSRQSISSLMDIRPDYANLESENGVERVDPDDVSIGDIIVIKPGERIPLDGEVLSGSSAVDTSALTGESLPRDLEEGSVVLSGGVNLTGVLRVKVTKEFEDSTVSKILDLVENASTKKAKAENFITKFARYYTPCVVFAALALALLPPLLFAQPWSEWVHRALIFLVVSCPCALVISIPLSFFGGIGGASKCGILIKGSNYLEALAEAETVVFDKTGTLTKGTFHVAEIHPEGIAEAELLELAAAAESYSTHPISVSLRQAFGKEIDPARITNVEEIAGRGVKATVDGLEIYAGNAKLMQQEGISFTESDSIGTTVHLAADGVYRGYLVIADEIKEDSAQAISALKQQGVQKTVMLTGDTRRVGEQVAKKLGIDTVYTELLPGDKVDKVEELLASKSAKGKLIFVGDGINDAPVLSRADIGIAMGGVGSDAAIEASDAVLMDDRLPKIAAAISISRKTIQIVKQNIVFALVIKLVVLLLGALGMANMWEAVFADVGVSVLAILNASRALRVKEFQNNAE